MDIKKETFKLNEWKIHLIRTTENFPNLVGYPNTFSQTDKTSPYPITVKTLSIQSKECMLRAEIEKHQVTSRTGLW